MSDFLDEKRREIDARVVELRPLVDEYMRLEAAAAALAGTTAASSAAPNLPRNAVSARPRQRGDRAPRSRGRPKGSGARANEALNLVKANPGITIRELAEKMGIKPNYCYRLLPGLAQDGLVAKEGRGWHPTGAS